MLLNAARIIKSMIPYNLFELSFDSCLLWVVPLTLICFDHFQFALWLSLTLNFPSDHWSFSFFPLTLICFEFSPSVLIILSFPLWLSLTLNFPADSWSFSFFPLTLICFEFSLGVLIILSFPFGSRLLWIFPLILDHFHFPSDPWYF